MSDVPSILHEIHVKSSAGWVLHANYGLHERMNCLAAAEELFESGRFEAVWVVKESFNLADGTAHEEILYRSPCRPRPRGLNSGMAAPDGSRPPNAAAKKRARTAARSRARAREKQENRSAGLAIVMAGLVGLGGAAFVAYLVVTAAQQLHGLDIALDDANSRNMIMSVFGIGFVLFFILMMRSFGPSLREARSDNAGATRSAKPVAPGDATAPADQAGGEAEPQFAIEKGSEEQALAEFDEHRRAEDTCKEEPGKEETGKEDADEEEAESELASPLLKAAASVSADLLKFIGDSLERLVAAGRQLNAFNRFGLTLYFAGAGEYLALGRRLAAHEIQDILCTHLRMLGHTLATTRRFCGNIDEYLVSPRYFKMYEAGRDAAALRQQDPDGEPGAVEAMESWNELATPTVKHDNEFIAVMLTDIGASTALPSDRGDEVARRAVYKHDAIVRAVLAVHDGREIKRIGDGVMATFPRVASAVEGAIAMQQACERANAADPGLGLGLRIGVNAGEPIGERGDGIGTPARTAARVLTKADGDEIAVSDIVREMCAGTHHAFTKKGDYELEGSSEPVPIHLLDWRANAAANDTGDTGDIGDDTTATATADA